MIDPRGWFNFGCNTRRGGYGCDTGGWGCDTNGCGPRWPQWNPGCNGPFGFNQRFQSVWTPQLNGIYMKRDDADSVPLLINSQGATLVNADQLDFGWEAGYELKLSRRLGNGREIELRHFQIDDWTARGSAQFAPGDALGTNPRSIAQAAGTADLQYDSSLHSVEVNLINCTTPGCWRMSLGFRRIEVSDNLLQTFTSPGSAAELLIDTNNHLYGMQFGADGVLYRDCGLHVTSWVKGGVYGNVADQTTLFPSPTFANGIRRTSASFVGEMGLLGEYVIGPRLTLLAGYQLLWMSDLALASDQLPVMSDIDSGLVPSMLKQNDLLYHGAIFGANLRW